MSTGIPPIIIPTGESTPPIVIDVDQYLAGRKQAAVELFEGCVTTAMEALSGNMQPFTAADGKVVEPPHGQVAMPPELVVAILRDVHIDQGLSTVAEVLAWVVLGEAQKRIGAAEEVPAAAEEAVAP